MSLLYIPFGYHIIISHCDIDFTCYFDILLGYTIHDLIIVISHSDITLYLVIVVSH